MPRGWRRRLTECLGQIVYLRRMPEHHGSALSFSRNWRDRHPEPCVCGKPKMQPCCSLEKAWRCPSGPDSRPPNSARCHQSIPRWESGLTVGNITHLTPSLQQMCICHRCPRTTKRCGHLNGIFALRAISQVCQRAKRPPSRLKSSARCCWSGCTCFFR